ncbi:MAG TPA: class I SAM-dependent methyltransferase [Pyrinomonadaceae bacterium]
MKSESIKGVIEVNRSKVNEDPICDFYTKHPFPPPIENLDGIRDQCQNENLHRAEYHLLWPHKEYRADLDVLVAGCGTFQSAKYAFCHSAARVVGIDVSSTSLEHTERLKRNYNLTNLDTRQLPIERVQELEQQFDLIICTGVLHHLADPDAGLRALRSVLNPEGAMNLMVYAPYGRAGVRMIQEYCRRLGIETSHQEIHDLISVLKVLPQHHPVLSSQRGSRDFFNTDALADALLNPRDIAYSVPQLFDFIERNDLRLARWYLQAAYLPQCGQIPTTPHGNTLATLPEREQYVAMELWRGLMSNHSFVVHRSDSNNDALPISFNDKSYLRYVPIRMPWTMCVQEGIPEGAAGVLLNQTHLFQDLFLVISEEEKQLFEAIDGHRSISEIVKGKKKASSLAREFFEKLWWYDQVVFDTSQGLARRAQI